MTASFGASTKTPKPQARKGGVLTKIIIIMSNITQQTYEFYFKQYGYIVNNVYANPKIRVKCLTELEKDIIGWKEVNFETEDEEPNIWRQLCKLQHFVAKDKNTQQSIIDRNKALS
jgi:hypothetical protein